MHGLLLARDSGDQAAALEGLRAVLTRADDLPRARLALVQLLTTQGDLLAARTELETVLRARTDTRGKSLNGLRQIIDADGVGARHDHRVLDGHQTNAWLTRFVEVLESWPLED